MYVQRERERDRESGWEREKRAVRDRDVAHNGRQTEANSWSLYLPKVPPKKDEKGVVDLPNLPHLTPSFSLYLFRVVSKRL